MKRLLFTVFLMLIFCYAYADPEILAGEKLAQSCAACHGPQGNSMIPMYPSIDGQNKKYFIEQMQQFKEQKEGIRNNAIMQGMAANLSTQQIKELAAYFSVQKIKHGQTQEKYVKLGQKWM